MAILAPESAFPVLYKSDVPRVELKTGRILQAELVVKEGGKFNVDELVRTSPNNKERNIRIHPRYLRNPHDLIEAFRALLIAELGLHFEAGLTRKDRKDISRSVPPHLDEALQRLELHQFPLPIDSLQKGVDKGLVITTPFLQQRGILDEDDIAVENGLLKQARRHIKNILKENNLLKNPELVQATERALRQLIFKGSFINDLEMLVGCALMKGFGIDEEKVARFLTLEFRKPSVWYSLLQEIGMADKSAHYDQYHPGLMQSLRQAYSEISSTTALVKDAEAS